MLPPQGGPDFNVPIGGGAEPGARASESHRESLTKLVSTPVLKPPPSHPARFGVEFPPQPAALYHRGCLRRPCRHQDQDL